jgi:hypothetical protein
MSSYICAKCKKASMKPTSRHHNTDLGDDYYEWECQTPGCGWVTARRPEGKATENIISPIPPEYLKEVYP